MYDATPLKTTLADKYLVRNWIKEKIGEKYLIELLGAYDSFDELDLYLIEDDVKFGEMTFTPANGMMKWIPEQAAYDLGKLIELPSK